MISEKVTQPPLFNLRIGGIAVPERIHSGVFAKLKESPFF
jgi:hypothetical protein